MAKRSHKIAAFLTLGIIAVFAITIVLAYFLPSRDPISVLLKRVYPQMIVGGRIISINDFEQAEIIGARFGVSSTQAKTRQLQYEKSEQLARQLKLPINSDDAADELNFYKKGNEAEFNTLLSTHYEDSERLFYKYAIYPQVVDAALRMKYYDEIKSTSSAYVEAQEVLEKILRGESFETLARTHSDDKTSGSIGGDLGFYQQGQLLPELHDQASISAMGEVRPEIIVSRLGYHIIFPVSQSMDDGNKQYNLKHILFTPDGYDQWLESKLNNISTITFLGK